MSRHDLSAKAECPHVVRACVGWDRPLQTFFAQLFTRTDDESVEGEATLWVGTAPGELSSPAAAIALVAPYADIPADLEARLEAEMQADVGRRDTAPQAAIKQMLFGRLH